MTKPSFEVMDKIWTFGTVCRSSKLIIFTSFDESFEVATDYTYSSLLPRIANFLCSLLVPSLSTLVLLWWRMMLCLQSLIKTLFVSPFKGCGNDSIQMQIGSTAPKKNTSSHLQDNVPASFGLYQIFLTRCWTDN